MKQGPKCHAVREDMINRHPKGIVQSPHGWGYAIDATLRARSASISIRTTSRTRSPNGCTGGV